MTTAQSTTFAAKIFHPNAIQVVSVALVLVFGVLYLIQMNEASMRGYAMRDLEERRRELVRENDKLLTEIDRLRSLESISERQTFLGLVKAEKIEYVKATRSDVAFGK